MSNFVSKENLMEENKAINNTFAKKTGAYPNLTAGNLVDAKATGTERVFNLDTSCGDASIEDDGTAIIKHIEGNTIVANQLVAPTNDNVSSGTVYSEVIDGTDKQVVELELKGKTELFKDTTEDLNYIINQITAGNGSAYYHPGDKLIFNYTKNDINYSCPMIVVDHHDAIYEEGGNYITKHALWLEAEFTGPGDLVFDPPEAMCTISSAGLPAGTYYFGDGSAMYEFTITEPLQEGNQLKFGSSMTTMGIYTDNKSTSIGSVSISSVESSAGVYLGTLGGSDYSSAIAGNFLQENGHILNTKERIINGYSRWSQSYMRQYLNGTGVGWWTALNVFDRAPSGVDSIVGYLSGLPIDIQNKLKPTRVYTKKPTTAGTGNDVTYDKIFLASRKQRCTQEDGESSNVYIWEYYRQLADSVVGAGNTFRTYTKYPILIKYSITDNNTIATYPSLRNSYGDDYRFWRITADGSTGVVNANAILTTVAPAFVLFGD